MTSSNVSVANSNWSRGDVWTGPASWIWSVASWAGWRSFYNNLDWGWNNSKSGKLCISLAFNPSESVVLHDEEGNLGHGFSKDISTVDVDGIVIGDDWSGHSHNWSWLVFVNLSDDFLLDVVNLRLALDDGSAASKVESVRNDVGAITSPAVLVEISVVQFVVRSVEGRIWLAWSGASLGQVTVNIGTVTWAQRSVLWLGSLSVKRITDWVMAWWN